MYVAKTVKTERLINPVVCRFQGVFTESATVLLTWIELWYFGITYELPAVRFLRFGSSGYERVSELL